MSLAIAIGATAADTTPSAEKARKALATLQSDAPPADKAMACKQLAIYGTPDAVPALAPLLSNADLASWARIALEAMPGPAADEALRGALGKLQGNLLVGVINSIGVRGDPKAVDGLAARLNDADADVASAAAVALGRIGGDPAVKALQPYLSAAPAGVRSAVAEGCILCAERFLDQGRFADAVTVYDTVRRADVAPQRILEATRGAILARQSDGIPLLLETLRSADKAVFGIGLRTARELPGRAVTEALAAELDKANPDRQGRLLLAMTDRGDAAVWPAVFTAVQKGSKNLRMVAIGVLERQGNASALPVLLAAATDPDADVAKAGKTALGRLPGKEIEAELAIRLPQATGLMRRVLIELAGQQRVTAAVPELVRACQDADPAIRTAGIKALGETAAATDLRSLTRLLADAKSADETSEVEAALESACTRIPDKAACADQLLAGLPGSAPTAQSALLRLLGTTGTAQGLAAVRSAFASQDPVVRDTAFRVLADWPEAPALPALIEAYGAAKDQTQRTLALRGCVRLLGLGGQPLDQIVRTYANLLASTRRVDDRKLVLSGLANVADPAALKLVEPLLAEAEIRAEAELAMLNIAGGVMGSAPAEAKAIAAKLQTESKSQVSRDRAAKILQQLDKVEDFITAWQVSGPYTATESGRSLFQNTFAPEKDASKAAWRLLPAGTQPNRPWMLDLLAALSGESRAGYARTWIYSGQAQPARIEFGTDDGHKLWLNGKLVAEANRGGAAVPGDFKSTVELRQGWNALLLKVVQDTGPWEFCLRLRSPSGGRIEGLRVQSVPPES